MNLKETTEHSSDQLRGIATAVFVVGLIIGVVLITLGVVSMLQEDTSQQYRYSRSVLAFILNAKGVGSILFGAIIFFWHYIIYVMISAYATIVENSDRTDVVDALMEINETLSGANDDVDIDFNDKRVKKAVAADFAREDNDDVELEKIDISDIKD